ncbi:hypothetical protein AB833_12655 [Chromatiales bacterium (ex Bugula neritina AB1)]|nr:hypothetical protein AB833_12655 [Chromatiales bacterium (ex Bugula neritina AB1)]
MQGFPPDSNQQVTLANWRSAPFSQWAFHHVREIVPSADILNAPGDPWVLESAPVNLGGLNIDCNSDGVMSLAGFQSYAALDAMIVLHRDKIVHEDYHHGMQQSSPHILMSVSKSLLGMVAAILRAQGKLNPEALVTDLIPELKNTAYNGATIQHLLNMQAAIDFDEDYLATAGAIVEYRKSTNWNPLEDGEKPSDLRSFFQTLTRKNGDHGGPFFYVSPNTDLLAWVIERATNSRYADVLSECLWQPMGAESSAYITVDRLGAPRAAGGVCTTLRDLTRVARLICNNGRRGDSQILPVDWVNTLINDADLSAWNAGNFTDMFPDQPVSYTDQWYTCHSNPADEANWLIAIGIHGQNIFIDPQNEFIMVKFASHEAPLTDTAAQHGLSAARAIRDYLVNHF